MTIAYWCVLIIIIFPYIFTVLAKAGPGFDNRNPRHYLQQLTGWHQRAHYVQLNSFEAMPAFGLAVIIAHLTQTTQSTIDTLAVIFVIARLLYALFYLLDKPTLRSLAWGVGMICVIGFFC